MHSLIIKSSILFAVILSTRSDKKHFYSQRVFGHTSNDSIPGWVKQLYERNENEFLNNAIPTAIFYKKLSDSTSYCLYQVDDGVCQQTFLATQKNRKKNKTVKIGNECDQDFTFPTYSITTYKQDTVHNTFVVTIEVEKAKQKYLITDQNGRIRFKDGYNMENAETIHDLTRRILSIDHSANIITKARNNR